MNQFILCYNNLRMKPSSHQQTISIDGSNVNYWIYHPDKSPTIVMVHGFRGNHHGLEEIARMLPEFRIIIPDLPGFGESTPLDNPHTIDGYTKFLKAFILGLGLEKPVVLGHSFGSIITAHFAAHNPKMVDKLILINPIASPALKGPRGILTRATIAYYWLGEKLPEKAGRKWLSHPMIVLAMSALLAKTSSKELRKKIHSSHLTHFSSFQTRAVVLESFRASVNHTAIEKADMLTMPTLLIAGEQDDIAPLAAQYELKHKAKNAQLVIVPHVGHLIHYEAPVSATEAIKDFVQNKNTR
jgi:pimeloyl-ACP methyl ester carboxylesterase